MGARMSNGDNESDFAKSVNEQTINSANVLLRTLIIIHGGAAVALLAFIGSIAGSEWFSPERNIAKLTMPLVWFGWGVVVAVVAMLFAYFTNYMTVGHTFALIEDNQSSVRFYGRIKTLFHVIALLAALSSLAIFLCGMYQVRFAIQAIAQ
jgi:hypothetical protein